MKCFVSILVFLCTISLKAQVNSGFSFGAGQFFKHTPKIQFDPPNPYFFANFSIQKSGSDSLSWNKFWNISEIQHSLSFVSLGDPDILGYSLVYVPGFHFVLWQKKNNSLEFGLKSGFSWHSKTYDSFDNPLNNTISSRMNSASRLSFSWNWATKKYGIHSGIFFHHYSNMAIKTPNLGFNAYGIFSSLQLKQEANPKAVNYLFDPFEKIDSRWKYFAFIHYGAKESGAATNGPLFKMGTTGVGVMYHFKNYIRFLTIIEYEWDGEKYAFYKSNLTTYSRPEAIKLANSWMIAGGFEFLFGPIGLRFSPGFYLKNGPLKSYSRVGVHYYFNIPKTHSKLAFGISLKYHKFDAHYGALTISYQL